MRLSEDTTSFGWDSMICGSTSRPSKEASSQMREAPTWLQSPKGPGPQGANMGESFERLQGSWAILSARSCGWRLHKPLAWSSASRMAWQQDPALHRWYIDTWCNKQKLLVSCPVSDTFLCPTKHMTRTCGGHVGCVLVAAWQAFQRGHFALLNLIWSAAIQTVPSTPHGIVSNLSHWFWLVFSQLRINLRHWHQPSNISICCNSFCLNLPINILVKSTPFCPTTHRGLWRTLSMKLPGWKAII